MSHFEGRGNICVGRVVPMSPEWSSSRGLAAGVRTCSSLVRSLTRSLGARSGDIDLKCADGRQEDVDLAPLLDGPTCFMRKLEMRCYVSESEKLMFSAYIYVPCFMTFTFLLTSKSFSESFPSCLKVKPNVWPPGPSQELDPKSI